MGCCCVVTSLAEQAREQKKILGTFHRSSGAGGDGTGGTVWYDGRAEETVTGLLYWAVTDRRIAPKRDGGVEGERGVSRGGMVKGRF